MRFKILFSIAVHEKMDVVLDMLKNIQHYAPDSAVVLHVASDFQEEFSRYSLTDYTNVFTNPESLITGFSDQTLFFVHYANLLFAESTGIQFDKWSMFASNQLFVREGVECYLDKFDSSTYTEKLDFDIHRYRFLQDNVTKAAVDSFGFEMRKVPPEGTFYSRADILIMLSNKKLHTFFLDNLKYFVTPKLAQKRVWLNKRGKKLIRAKFGLAVRIFPNIFKRFIYASEELIFPTVLGRSNKRIGEIYCFLNWSNNLEVTKADVDKVASGCLPGVYAVKRVDRVLDDPLRVYIRESFQDHVDSSL